MVTRKKLPKPRKPSRLLGFLLLALLFAFLSFSWWQSTLDEGDPKLFGPQQWVVAFAAITAMVGWIIASIITMRNSIKQHTITTLLQSRLSATYMGYADKVSAHYVAYDEERKANPQLDREPSAGIDEAALRYILNYFEFVAIGIQRGDLDEGMLRDSLRSILIKNVAMSRSWIDAARKTAPRLYCNLAWLHARWAPQEVQLVSYDISG
jgi:hypothetical protein